MNLGDPKLELIDPTPNVHILFVRFDKEFFWSKLTSSTAVRWSKRMYSCAGICSYYNAVWPLHIIPAGLPRMMNWFYDCGGGFCDIALSEPLLKLRPRKDLVETLLHEMIHAYLFVTKNDQDRDGHGPVFQAHMHRINKAAGLNITIYHSFHDEVQLYQTHWWRCNGRCQSKGPHFGIVRRTTNRAPGPNDYWWSDHSRNCGGTFVKIKEPDNEQKPKGTAIPTADIRKYITNNIKTINNVPNSKPVLKDSSNIKTSRTNNSHSVVVINKQVITVPNPVVKTQPVFTGSGNTLSPGSNPYPVGVTETVRNIWSNKILNKMAGAYKEPVRGVTNPKKHKAGSPDLQSPPTKIKKIDSYFNGKIILKDLYGDDIKLTQPSNGTKLVAVNLKVELVECPVCNVKFKSDKINTHLDECLNKDIIEKLSKEDMEGVGESPPCREEQDTQTVRTPKPKEIKHVTPPTPFEPKAAVTSILGGIKNDPIDLTICEIHTDVPKKNINSIPAIPAFKPIPSLPKCPNNNMIDLTNLNYDTNDKTVIKCKGTTESEVVNIDTVTALVEEIEAKTVSCNKRRNTDSFINTNRGDTMSSEKDKVNAGPSTKDFFGKICPCCGKEFDKEIEVHLDECLIFFDNNTTIPDEGASTSFTNNTILIEDDNDRFDDSQIFNATGTKTPCPCCMKMVEQDEMNKHLDLCLQ